MSERPCHTLVFSESSDMIGALQKLLESGPGAAAGTVLELFLRQTNRMRIDIEGAYCEAGRSTESGLAVRRIINHGQAAGFAAVSRCGLEGYLAALRRADQEVTPLDPDLRPAGLTDWKGREFFREEAGSTPSQEELIDWLEKAVQEVEQRAGEVLPLKVVHAWVEAGVTVEGVVNSAGLQAGRSCTRIWAGMQMRWEVAGKVHESFRLLVPRAAAKFPQIDPVLERFQSATTAGRVLDLRPGSILVLLPESAAALVQVVAAVTHGDKVSIGEPVGEAWSLVDEPALPRMPFGGTFDGVGFPSRTVVLAAEGRIRAGLTGPGHAWRRSYKDPPARGFSNLVVKAPARSRPDGIVVTALTVHRLAPNRCFAVGEAVGGRIRFHFTPTRVPVLLRGACGRARATSSGILTPELVLGL